MGRKCSEFFWRAVRELDPEGFTGSENDFDIFLYMRGGHRWVLIWRAIHCSGKHSSYLSFTLAKHEQMNGFKVRW